LLTTNLIENPILRMMVNQIMQMTTRKIILFLVVLFAIWAVLSYLILFVFVFESVFMYKDQAFNFPSAVWTNVYLGKGKSLA
jgi:nitrate reductase NapE component